MKQPIQHLNKNFIQKASVLVGIGALMLGAVVLDASLFRASAQSAAQPTSSGSKTSVIDWQPSFAAALAQAKTGGKLVMVDFGAKWCGACKMMEENTYPDAKVSAESKKFVMVKVDVDEHEDIAARYGISSLPTTAWLRADGKPIAGAIGALEPGDLIAAMREATKRAQRSNSR
ncbi:Thioredoxin [Abditibacterium utsteinense]|uniref:Thioredoxin n=1 Tax=Abditibacterium utsteinense TaxID=1960156 RepID=A0A2S8SPH7_9BACT|nr:thioredoxin family protein [Abditibacterium utsteinense]PQV62705.1 Thioredoxin [Abditibacterium utsteinense]